MRKLIFKSALENLGLYPRLLMMKSEAYSFKAYKKYKINTKELLNTLDVLPLMLLVKSKWFLVNGCTDAICLLA